MYTLYDAGIKNNTHAKTGRYSLPKSEPQNLTGIKNNTRTMVEWSDNK